MKVLYFAWLRNKTGVNEEDVDPPAEIATVDALVDWLKARSTGHADAFANTDIIRVAINQEFADFGDTVASGDEVAFFPPMTGG